MSLPEKTIRIISETELLFPKATLGKLDLRLSRQGDTYTLRVEGQRMKNDPIYQFKQPDVQRVMDWLAKKGHMTERAVVTQLLDKMEDLSYVDVDLAQPKGVALMKDED